MHADLAAIQDRMGQFGDTVSAHLAAGHRNPEASGPCE